MKKFFVPVLIIMLSGVMSAQSVIFSDDALGRGYTDRPYLRYEAEDGLCQSNDATFISSRDNYNQSDLAAEASNRMAATIGADGSELSWTLDADANALTIRFSIPDSPDGFGTKRVVTVYDGDKKLCDITLDSYWAWQYTVKNNSSTKYPDNTPGSDKFVRMRFDEVSALLPATVKSGSTLRLVCNDGGDGSVTIDFVEAEMAPPAAQAPAGAVTFEGAGDQLQGFINSNAGKTIFIPAGVYEIPSGLEIRNDDTRLVGAGMWHTTLMFTAKPDNPRTYGRRGITCNRDRCGVEDLTINTLNNHRYYNNDETKQAGKALMGSWGKNSTIRNVRADHFECGAWIADYNGNSSDGLTVTGCRFRNNYADGINLCSGTSNATVSHCSFRNNGDDDMASWSTGNWTHDNLFDHNTAENNWRASSLGFFGGRNNHATNLLIIDAMESGARVNADFQGTGFSSEGEILLENIAIRSSGVRQGQVGQYGDFWGNAQPSLMISAGYHYDVVNTTLRNIDIHDSYHEGLRVKSSNSKKVKGLKIEGLHIHNVPSTEWAVNFSNGLQGDGTGTDITADGCPEPWMTTIPSTFDFKYDGSALETVGRDNAKVCVTDGCIRVSEDCKCPVTVYDAAGRTVAVIAPGNILGGLDAGFYIVASDEADAIKIKL